MTEVKLWKILYNDVVGWNPIEEPFCVKLTKDQCQQRLEELMAEGYNPNHLKAIPDA
tara:strand:+ start:241 stop:411 length:171 start_codon:yes stop_codon:yes gene_type:complete